MAPDEGKLNQLRLRAMKKIVRAAHRKGIDTFVSVGRSAGPGALFFTFVWKSLYPKEAPPKRVSLGDFFSRIDMLKDFSDKSAGERLLKHRPGLRERIDSRIMLFDELALSGTTLRLAKTVFEMASAKNLTTTAFFATNRGGRPFLPSEGASIYVKRVADVVGCFVKSRELAERASYWKQRDLRAASKNLKKVAFPQVRRVRSKRKK